MPSAYALTFRTAWRPGPRRGDFEPGSMQKYGHVSPNRGSPDISCTRYADCTALSYLASAYPLSTAMSRFYRPLLTSLLLGAVLTFSACDSNEANEEELGTPPPPVSSQMFDTSGMMTLPVRAAEAALDNSNPGDNFLNAAARVAITSGVIGAQLYIPFLTTSIAQAGEPGYESGLWIWRNTVPVSDRDVTFVLTTTSRPPEADPVRVDWDMHVIVDDNGDVTDDLLYDGFTDDFQRTGSFIVYAPLNKDFGNDVPVLSIDFDGMTPDYQEIRFESLTDVYDHPGDVATYEVGAVTARFLLVEPHNSKQHEVIWDIDSLAGQLTATDYNGGMPACWDADLQDVPCP